MSAVSRKKLACRHCTLRKVKCNKVIPCDNCTRRGTASECERDEPDDLSTTSAIPLIRNLQPDSIAAINALSNRVAELQAALQRQNGDSSIASSTNLPPEGSVVRPRVDRSPLSECSNPEEIEDTVTTLEFLAWGRTKNPDKAMLSPEALRVGENENENGITPAADELDWILSPGDTLFSWLQILLPSRRQVYQLVDYHNDCLLWFHGSYIASSFSKQLDAFFTDHSGQVDSNGVDLQWVALLFSVIAGTITCAPDQETRQWGFDMRESKLLSQKWHRAVTVALNAANYSSNHSIFAVQAITTLTNTAHMLGHSNNQSIMLAAAIRIAQSLGMHRLDEDARGSDEELETGRRVWQELCTQDWFSTSFSESYFITPLHSTSLPPKNYNEDTMEALPESEPTVTSFCRFLNRIAVIMPALQDAMAMSNTLYTKHEAVLAYDKKMRSLATGRPHFFTDIDIDMNWPRYVPWARRAIAMSSAHKIIMIHRKFLGLSFTNRVFAFSRRTCLAAAKTILREYLASCPDPSSPMLWTHQAFSVAACIIISFDNLHEGSSSDDTCSELVDQTLCQLQLCQQRSMIAARGIQVLQALQKQVSNRTESRKRRHDSTTDDSSPRKRAKGFDATEFVRTICDLEVDQRPRNHTTAPQMTNTIENMSDSRANINNSRPFKPSESIVIPTDLDWFWHMPPDANDSQTFDNLLSLADQGLGF